MKLYCFALSVPLALACGGGNPVSEPSALETPAGVQCVAADDTSLEFSWDAVQGAETYHYRLAAGSSAADNGETAETRVRIGSLQPGTSYSFQVYAVAGSVRSAYSSVVMASTTSGGGTSPGGDTDGSARCVDAPLVFDFDGDIAFGSSGLIRVFAADGTQVDKIDMADMATVTLREDGIMLPKTQITAETKYNTFMDAILGAAGCYRVVHYTPLRIEGRRLYVKLHNSVLEHGKSYYATVDESVVGKPCAKLEFSTKARPSGTTLTVSADGSGDFCTVQGALSFVTMQNKNTAYTLSVGEGDYSELLYLRNKNNVTIQGAGAGKTRIVHANTEKYCSSTGGRVAVRPTLGASVGTPGGRSLFLAESTDMLVLEDLSLVNEIGADDGQAECLYFNADNGKLLIGNCALLSWQDTFETKGSVYVHHSLIAGHVDFIWGSPKACLFEDCEIRSRASGRYVVQARVPSASDKGFVFLNCRLTVENGASGVYLARANDHSKESTATFDNVTYVNCTMDGVAAQGWYTSPMPNPGAATAVSGWKEYGSKDASGGALPIGSRASCARQLTEAEAAAFSSREAVLGW